LISIRAVGFVQKCKYSEASMRNDSVFILSVVIWTRLELQPMVGATAYVQ